MSLHSRLMILLIILQIDSAILLWSTAFTGNLSGTTFALFLVVDLVGFAMISYTYRLERYGEHPGRFWLTAGCSLIVAIMFASLVFA